MKRLALSAVCALAIHLSHAQFINNNSIYLSGGLNGGNYKIGNELGIHFIAKDSYIMSIGINRNKKTPPSKPDDFKPIVLFPFFASTNNVPYNQITSFKFTLGKIIYLNKKESIRLNTNIGIAFTETKQAINFQELSPILFRPRYSYDYEYNRHISLVIDPKLDFLFNNYYGWSVSPIAIINKRNSYFGIGLDVMVGFLKPK